MNLQVTENLFKLLLDRLRINFYFLKLNSIFYKVIQTIHLCGKDILYMDF